MTQLVHSLWTVPYRESPFKTNGGFKTKYYFFLSAILSFFSFKKNIPNSFFKLVTDDIGASLLIDELGLPYDSIDLKLNYIKTNSDIWSIGKLHAFQQEKQFLHVDFDAYLFKPIVPNILNADIVVCNTEDKYKIYNGILDQFKSGVKVYDTIYRKIISDYEKSEEISSYNLGIFGGKNLSLINEYCERSLKMCELNRKGFRGIINKGGITCIIEQVYLAYFLKERKIVPTTLLENDWINNPIDHINDANKKGFTHLVSESKRNQVILNLLENRVKEDHPKFFEKLQDLKKKTIEIYDIKIK